MYSIIMVTKDTLDGDMSVSYYANNIASYEDAVNRIVNAHPIVHNAHTEITLTLKDDNDREYTTRSYYYKKQNLTAEQIRQKMSSMKAYSNYANALKYIDDDTIKGFWRCGTPKNYRDIQERIRSYFIARDWKIENHQAMKGDVTITIP